MKRSMQFLALPLLLCGATALGYGQSSVTMNEIFTRGTTGNLDWIEIYNSTASPIDIGGYKIYDIGGQGGTKPKKAIPTGTLLAAKGFYVVITDTNTSDTVKDAFGLSNSGETVWLENATGTIIDTVAIPALGADTSWARTPDGSTSFVKLSPMTRGTTNGGSTGVEEEGTTITRYALHQNYPNPFNPSTTISFDLLSSSAVSLKIYDVLGREVATLFEGQRSAGHHAITFDARDLASGVYLCRISTAHFSASTRMLLMK